MLFFVSCPSIPLVAENNLVDRLERLIDAAVSATRFESRADFLEQAGVSTGYLGNFRKRVEKNPEATLTAKNAAQFAKLLRMTTGQLLTAITGDEPPVDDPYPGRAVAMSAARALKFPEVAIQATLLEDPGSDPGPLYWFRRIESETERLRPASGSDS